MNTGKSPCGSVSVVLMVILLGLLSIVSYGLHVAQRSVKLQQREEWSLATQYASESAANWALAYCRQHGVPDSKLQVELSYPHAQVRTWAMIHPHSEQGIVIEGCATGPDTNRQVQLRLREVRAGDRITHIQVDKVST